MWMLPQCLHATRHAFGVVLLTRGCSARNIIMETVGAQSNSVMIQGSDHSRATFLSSVAYLTNHAPLRTTHTLQPNLIFFLSRISIRTSFMSGNTPIMCTNSGATISARYFTFLASRAVGASSSFSATFRTPTLSPPVSGTCVLDESMGTTRCMCQAEWLGTNHVD